MKFEVLKIEGLKSQPTLAAYGALLMGLKMTPEYAFKSYEEFLDMVHKLPEEDIKKIFRSAFHFVPMEEDELLSFLRWVKDPNGVPFSHVNVKNLSLEAIREAVVAVCLEITRFKIDLVSDDEKKNSLTSL